MTRENDYRNLRDQVARLCCPDNKLTLIKEYFSEEIASPRRLDVTNSLFDLLRILEKRDSLHIEDINALKYIAVTLQNNNIIAMIDAYNGEPHVNPVPVQNDQPNSNNDRNDRVIPQIDSDPIERVYKLICTEIGQKWKDFARKLRVTEGYIDDLEYKHRNRISDMVREILVHHRETADERFWRVNLCNALSDARRRDLSRDVQNIFAQYQLM